ncbi:hypothetical protein [Streptococcus anginosus]|uniref:hypothetical protein n=1 Tax=Streptococcus anginosus TaxID=1328 RepID=UPI00398D324A
MKKIVKSICLALTVVTILSACSTAQKQSETTQKTEKTEVSEFKKPVGIYEHFKTAKNELWYRVSEVDKNKEISDIWLVNKGKVKIYSVPDSLKLGDISKMSDKEIIKQLPKWYEQVKQDWITYLKEATYPEEKASLEHLQRSVGKDVTSQDLKVNIKTDTSGNETISEEFSYLVFEGRNASPQRPLYDYTSFNSVGKATIFDSQYTTFYTYDSNRGTLGEYLITRTTNPIVMDSPNTKGVKVD